MTVTQFFVQQEDYSRRIFDAEMWYSFSSDTLILVNIVLRLWKSTLKSTVLYKIIFYRIFILSITLLLLFDFLFTVQPSGSLNFFLFLLSAIQSFNKLWNKWWNNLLSSGGLFSDESMPGNAAATLLNNWNCIK